MVLCQLPNCNEVVNCTIEQKYRKYNDIVYAIVKTVNQRVNCVEHYNKLGLDPCIKRDYIYIYMSYILARLKPEYANIFTLRVINTPSVYTPCVDRYIEGILVDPSHSSVYECANNLYKNRFYANGSMIGYCSSSYNSAVNELKNATTNPEELFVFALARDQKYFINMFALCLNHYPTTIDLFDLSKYLSQTPNDLVNIVNSATSLPDIHMYDSINKSTVSPQTKSTIEDITSEIKKIVLHFNDLDEQIKDKVADYISKYVTNRSDILEKYTRNNTIT